VINFIYSIYPIRRTEELSCILLISTPYRHWVLEYVFNCIFIMSLAPAVFLSSPCLIFSAPASCYGIGAATIWPPNVWQVTVNQVSGDPKGGSLKALWFLKVSRIDYKFSRPVPHHLIVELWCQQFSSWLHIVCQSFNNIAIPQTCTQESTWGPYKSTVVTGV
jgi:hypothetical protein